MQRWLLLVLGTATAVGDKSSDACPSCANPPWPASFRLMDNTLTMTCNHSGWTDPMLAANFAVVSYDWHNNKENWCKDQPMDNEASLIKQAHMTRAYTNRSRIWLYRNIVKALPWYGTVREKLDDPAYSGFFLRYNCTNSALCSQSTNDHCDALNTTLCSTFYHDQEQTPSVPGLPPPAPRVPDGSCLPSGCNCGSQPCGEYLFDHRNGSMLQEWLVKELIGGPLGLGDEAISGFFLDDYWCSNKLNGVGSSACIEEGASEIDRYQLLDMGLTPDDVRDITLGWQANMKAVESYILSKRAYSWSLMYGGEHANARPIHMWQGMCPALLRAACVKNSSWQQHTMLYGIAALENGTIYQLEQVRAWV